VVHTGARLGLAETPTADQRVDQRLEALVESGFYGLALDV
jgi:hypothetical protein